MTLSGFSFYIWKIIFSAQPEKFCLQISVQNIHDRMQHIYLGGTFVCYIDLVSLSQKVLTKKNSFTSQCRFHLLSPCTPFEDTDGFDDATIHALRYIIAYPNK